MNRKIYQTLLRHGVLQFREVCKRCRTAPATAPNQSAPGNKRWETVIGLEIHMQVASTSKLFSAAPNRYESPLNSTANFLDASLPGTLPVINRRCIEAAVATAHALNAEINLESTFNRKHYFYADMPCGYQITQLHNPIARNGHVEFWVYDNNNAEKEYKLADLKRIRVTQIQIEQDSGKSLQDTENSRVLVNLNRAGVGLLEIVTEPDFRSAKEASRFASHLSQMLTRIGSCNCNFTECEIDRQISLVENGGEVIQETRGYDRFKKQTMTMRDKDDLLDYRFMPEPNLPPLLLYDPVQAIGFENGVKVNLNRDTANCGIELPTDEIDGWVAKGVEVFRALDIQDRYGDYFRSVVLPNVPEGKKLKLVFKHMTKDGCERRRSVVEICNEQKLSAIRMDDAAALEAFFLEVKEFFPDFMKLFKREGVSQKKANKLTYCIKKTIGKGRFRAVDVTDYNYIVYERLLKEFPAHERPPKRDKKP